MEEEREVIKAEGTEIEPGTIARTVCLFLALVNQTLAILGKGTVNIADDRCISLCQQLLQ